MVFLLLCVWCLSPPPSSWTSSIFVSVTLEWCIARSRYSVNSCEVTTTQHGGRMAWVSAYAPKYRSRAVVWAQLSNHWTLKFHSSWWVFSLIALFKILYMKGNVLNICILLHLNFVQIKFIWDAMVLYFHKGFSTDPSNSIWRIFTLMDRMTLLLHVTSLSENML